MSDDRESDEVIKSSVEDLVPILSESEGILDNMCDVPFIDKNHFDAGPNLIESLLNRDTSIVYSPKIDSHLEDFTGELIHIDPIPSGIDETDSDPKDVIRFLEQLLYDDTSSEDNSFEDINFVEASPPDSELVSLKETFSDHTKDTSSVSTTTHANNSLLKYDSFLFEIEPDQDFFSSDDSFGSGLEVSFPSRTRNKIFDPRIFFEVHSKRFLSRDTFSPTYVSLPFEDRHYLSFTYVIRTFLPYFTYPVESPFLLSSESEDIILNPSYPFFIFLL
uniref:Reverse transcriptase domain-containing protein n=1 Tax=Tanacetum cinerariifolium TaxID=118510 RepID=A0A6L2MV80_TANCI|nr:hypothetical protein [Tanacetum cinerariifolium]